jgi:hypothetical protein
VEIILETDQIPAIGGWGAECSGIIDTVGMIQIQFTEEIEMIQETIISAVRGMIQE